jgi:hypothetical protein
MLAIHKDGIKLCDICLLHLQCESWIQSEQLGVPIPWIRYDSAESLISKLIERGLDSQWQDLASCAKCRCAH